MVRLSVLQAAFLSAGRGRQGGGAERISFPGKSKNLAKADPVSKVARLKSEGSHSPISIIHSGNLLSFPPFRECWLNSPTVRRKMGSPFGRYD